MLAYFLSHDRQARHPLSLRYVRPFTAFLSAAPLDSPQNNRKLADRHLRHFRRDRCRPSGVGPRAINVEFSCKSSHPGRSAFDGMSG